MRTFSAIYRGNRFLELCVDVHLEENSEVIVVIPEEGETEEKAWASLVAAKFLDGYSEADSIYDDL